MALFDFLKKIPTMNEITGSMGEYLAKIYSKTLPGALVLHDILIDGAEGGTAQIDLVLVGNRGIYVVEVKNFSDAVIYGDTRKNQWHYYSHGRKYEIYSPLKQNQKHMEYLKRFLGDFGEIPCFSVVAMLCEDFKVSGGLDGHTVLCSSLPAMERGLYKLAEDMPAVMDDAKKREIFDYIRDHQHKGAEARAEHKQRVMEYKKGMENAKQQKICPYCNAELVLRSGKYGEFYGCSNYPRCRYTMKE